MKEPVWLGFALAIGIGFMVGAVWLRRPPSVHIQDSPPFVRVAMIGVDRSANVMQLLNASNIPVVTWGGSHTGYWVEVLESEAYRAIAVLRKDAKQLHYFINFGDQHPLSRGDNWITPWVDAPYSELLGRPQYSSTTDVGVCLRQPEVASVAKTYSKISRISYYKQELIGVAGRIAVIEDLWLEKFPGLYGGKRRFSAFQIIDGGGEVHCITDKESSKD